MTYYIFKNRTVFWKAKSLTEALTFSKLGQKIYRKAPGFPNPWYVNPVENGKVNKSVVVILKENFFNEKK